MANTNLHGEDRIRHCGLNDEGKAVMMDPHDLHRLIGTYIHMFLIHITNIYTSPVLLTGIFDEQNTNI